MIASTVLTAIAVLALQAAEPDPQVMYAQAAGCAGSAIVAQPPREDGAGVGPAEEEILTWGMAMAEFGRQTGRTSDQIDADAEQARDFFQQLQQHNPEAFDAHRAYCRAFLP